jgi:hypothetical protein
VEVHVVAGGGDIGVAPRDLGIQVTQQLLAAGHLGDVRAQRREDVPELRGDESAAGDDDVVRQFLDPHDGVRGVVGDGVQAGDVGDHRARSGGEHIAVGRDVGVPAGVQLDVHRLRPGEPPGAGVHGDVRALVALPVPPAAYGDRVDAAEDAVADGAPVHVLDVSLDAERRGAVQRVRDLGRVLEHLRRDAAHVQAGAAEEIVLDDRDGPVVEGRSGYRVAGAGADDDEVVMGHGPKAMRPAFG